MVSCAWLVIGQCAAHRLYVCCRLAGDFVVGARDACGALLIAFSIASIAPNGRVSGWWEFEVLPSASVANPCRAVSWSRVSWWSERRQEGSVALVAFEALYALGRRSSNVSRFVEWISEYTSRVRSSHGFNSSTSLPQSHACSEWQA